MIDVTCKVAVVEVNGEPATKASSLLVESWRAKGCGEGQYVTLVWGKTSITVRADDLRVAAANCARTVGADEETPF